jgi:predicted Fe-Mo cluster-binding NifX family protein
MAAPTEAKALSALKTVQSLSGKELDGLITREMGNSMLGVLDSLAKAMLPQAQTEDHHRMVHLMVLSYLMCKDVEKK